MLDQLQSTQLLGSGNSKTVLVSVFLSIVVGSSLFAQLVFGYNSLTFVLALCSSVFLVAVPEVTLALFLSAGAIKGAPGFSALLPFDVTVGLAALLILSCGINILFRAGTIRLPGAYLLYGPLFLTMLISLFYTPEFAVGLDKTLRFTMLTGVAIIGPFVILQSPSQLRRFLMTNVVCGVVIALTSFSMLGGYERLAAPSGLTIQLGYKSGIALAIIWAMVFPTVPFLRRCLWYPIVAVLLVGLIGSGGRAAMIATCGCICVSLYSYKWLISDLAIGGIFAALARPLVRIPDASYAYLATLISESPHQVLGFRDDLAALGMRLTMNHPFGGVGIGGYASYSPNPVEYNSPHNIFLEISSEMGMFAVLLFLALVLWTFWETSEQLRSDTFPHKILSRVVLVMLIFTLTSAMASGDMNDNRSMWLCMGLPFVVRKFNSRHTAVPSRVSSLSGS